MTFLRKVAITVAITFLGKEAVAVAITKKNVANRTLVLTTNLHVGTIFLPSWSCESPDGIWARIDKDFYWPFDVRCCDQSEFENEAWKNGWWHQKDPIDPSQLHGPLGKQVNEEFPGEHIYVELASDGDLYNKISKKANIFFIEN